MKMLKNQFGLLLLLTFVLMSFTTNSEIVKVENNVEIGGAYLTFANKFGGKLTKNDLMKNHTLGINGCAKGSKIFQFTLHITKNGKKKTYKGTSPKLTSEMLKAIRNLSKGDEFVFKNVKAYLPNRKDKVDVWGKPFFVI